MTPEVEPAATQPGSELPDQAEDPIESNPNCTTGNALACNRGNGEWDFELCTCTFAPLPTITGGIPKEEPNEQEVFEEEA